MQYLSYDDYVNLGGAVDESAFPRLERQAERYLDYYTQDRIKALAEIPEVVKEVMVEFVDTLNDFQGNSGTVNSFSHDGISVDFGDSKTQDAIMYEIVLVYLPIELITSAVGV